VSEIWWSQRPNKFVDRRLFAELLAKVDATRPLKEHAYISMGGPFLDDFPIIQSAVHLRSMMSIDREDGVRDRAEYNKPYSRVFCELADSSVLVSKFGSFADKLGAANFVVWLDFTTRQRGEQLRQLAELAAKLTAGDICRITLNAQAQRPYGMPVAAHQIRELGLLADDLGDLLPKDCTSEDMSPSRFPALLFKCIRNAAETGARRSGNVVRPLLLVEYKDGQQMITATFALEGTGAISIASERPLSDWVFLSTPEWTNVRRVAVGALSIKEIRHIDYARHAKSVDEIQAELPFLTPESIAQYVEYEPYFPRFRHVP